ncbi:uncharacterized protein LOC126839221 isoform X2 [Adelges cooleyi]|nr:uncharacterized protein LOC126839221 isoform X2 [Adelges cooleyi]
MIQWPWLMTFLVLISTVQWTCIKAQYPHEYNLNWREYSFLPKEYYTRTKRTNSLFQDTTTPITVDSNTYKYEQRAIITTTNVRISTTNLTKSFTTREQPSNDSTTHVSNGLKTPQSKSSSIVVFPNSAKEAVHTISVNKFIPDRQIIDNCSKNDSYCDKVDNYPRQDLQQIFRTSKFMSSGLFGVDAITDLETRISLKSVEPQPICGSLEQIVYPEAGLNKNNEWRYIVQGPNNDSNNYRQGIRVEK